MKPTSVEFSIAASALCSVSERPGAATSYRLQFTITRSGFAGAMCLYCCDFGQRAKPGFTSFVRSYQGSRPLHVERFGTGTGFDFFDGNVWVSPYRRYLATCVPASVAIGSPTKRTTRSSSEARTLGRSTFIGLWISGAKKRDSMQ